MMAGKAGLLMLLFIVSAALLDSIINAESVEDRVTYVGHEHPRPGAGWFITCKKFSKDDKINWTRDESPLQPEIDRGELKLVTTAEESTISSSDSKPNHSGTYKCTADSLRNHTLRVYTNEPSNGHENHKEQSTVSRDDKYRVFASRKIILPCYTTRAGSGIVSWKLNDTDLIIDEDHYELSENGIELTIKNPIESILGNYSCRVDRTSPTPLNFYQIIAQPTVSVDRASIRLGEGETLRLTCITEAKYGPQISWLVNNKTYTVSEDRVTLTPDNQGVENAVLTVESISNNDTGLVSCIVHFKNALLSKNATARSTFHVEDKPQAILVLIEIAIGIVITILGVIFVIYIIKKIKRCTADSKRPKPTRQKRGEPKFSNTQALMECYT